MLAFSAIKKIKWIHLYHFLYRRFCTNVLVFKYTKNYCYLKRRSYLFVVASNKSFLPYKKVKTFLSVSRNLLNAHAGLPAAVREMRPRFSPKFSEGLDWALESSRQTSNAFIWISLIRSRGKTEFSGKYNWLVWHSFDFNR